MRERPWRFSMRTLTHNRYAAFTTWRPFALTNPHSLSSAGTASIPITKDKDRWGPLRRIWWSTCDGYLCVDCIIFDDNTLDNILDLWQLWLYNTTHHRKRTIACGSDEKALRSCMLAPKGAGINIYVCVLGGSFCMFSWHHEAMDAVIRLVILAPAAF